MPPLPATSATRTAAANSRSWFRLLSATMSPRHLSANTRTGTLSTASTPRHIASRVSSMPALASAAWFAARHCSFAARSLAAISAATSSPPSTLTTADLAGPPTSLDDTSMVTSSRAQSRLAAFCGASGGPPLACEGTFSESISGSWCRNEDSRKND